MRSTKAIEHTSFTYRAYLSQCVVANSSGGPESFAPRRIAVSSMREILYAMFLSTTFSWVMSRSKIIPSLYPLLALLGTRHHSLCQFYWQWHPLSSYFQHLAASTNQICVFMIRFFAAWLRFNNVFCHILSVLICRYTVVFFPLICSSVHSPHRCYCASGAITPSSCLFA